ncbi:Uncharacterised protein [Chlamydia trachomatis]|nr:Uncharacterised protein [Chlamydia trachomatis]
MELQLVTEPVDSWNIALVDTAHPNELARHAESSQYDLLQLTGHAHHGLQEMPSQNFEQTLLPKFE